MPIHTDILHTKAGKVTKVTLTNKHRLSLTLLSYAASIYQIKVQDDIISVSPEDIETFIETNMNYGKTIGRQSGRTSIQPFMINDQTYQLVSNIKSNYQLHGGYHGFSKHNFDCLDIEESASYTRVVFETVSPDMADGFPGEVTLKVIYTLHEDDQIDIEFHATSTKDTYLNITNHTYFNFLGKNQQVLSHELYIPAVAYLKRTPDYDFIDVCPVDAAFDFSTKRTLLKAIEANDHQGFDDTFILDNEKELILTERMSPYIIEFKTTYPAVVIYTHNLRSPAIKDAYPEGGLYAGVAIECQYAPGGIHEPKIKMPLLKKDELYQHKTTITIKSKSTKI